MNERSLYSMRFVNLEHEPVQRSEDRCDIGQNENRKVTELHFEITATSGI